MSWINTICTAETAVLNPLLYALDTNQDKNDKRACADQARAKLKHASPHHAHVSDTIDHAPEQSPECLRRFAHGCPSTLIENRSMLCLAPGLMAVLVERGQRELDAAQQLLLRLGKHALLDPFVEIGLQSKPQWMGLAAQLIWASDTSCTLTHTYSLYR